MNKRKKQRPKVGLGGLDGKDVEFVRKIRNDNRHDFFSDHEVTRNGQREWWTWYNSDDSDLVMFCIYYRRNKVGTVSMEEIGQDTILIGHVALLEKFRGKGIMTAAIEKIMNRGGTFKAFVKMSSLGAINMFRGMGFDMDLDRDGSKVVFTKKVPVPKVTAS